jgi:hypothetical protein
VGEISRTIEISYPWKWKLTEGLERCPTVANVEFRPALVCPPVLGVEPRGRCDSALEAAVVAVAEAQRAGLAGTLVRIDNPLQGQRDSRHPLNLIEYDGIHPLRL